VVVVIVDISVRGIVYWRWWCKDNTKQCHQLTLFSKTRNYMIQLIKWIWLLN